MSAALDLEGLFMRAARASELCMVVRDEAREQAVVAIRDIERRLREAIAGDTLRGLRNLYRQFDGRDIFGAPPRLAARIVRGRGPVEDRRVDAPIEFGTREWVWTKAGALACWAVSLDGVFSERPLEDEELLAQDLEPVAATVAHVLARHCERAERTAANYERLAELAAAIRGACA